MPAGLPYPTIGRFVLRCIPLIAASIVTLTLAVPAQCSPPTSHHLNAAQKQLRDATYRSDPCLAAIVDVEDGWWDPTIDFGGGHGNTAESYGLGQADPGTKMAVFGPGWRTDPATQLRWMRSYTVNRYGSECAARDYRMRNGSY